MARRSNNREQIIAAAYQVLAEQGYEAASIKEIAKAAGIAPGLVHYYFKDKDDLLLSVLREGSNRYTEQMRAAKESQTPQDLPDAALQVPHNRVYQQPEWYRLRYELFVLGLRKPVITEGVAALLANGREGTTQVLSHLFPNADLNTLTGLAAILIATFDGLALQKLVDPNFDLESAYKVLAELIEKFSQEQSS